MNKIFTTEKELSIYPTLDGIIHHESDIYIKDEKTLYKVLLYGNRLTRESTIQKLSLYGNSNCVTPSGIIYTPEYQFIGFEMPYLKSYIPSTRLIFSNKISYKDKLRFAKKIAIAIEQLYKDGIVFWDIHPDNNMISKNGDIKIVDMDSVRFSDCYTRDEFQHEIACSHRLLSQLTLSYISKMNVIELSKLLSEDEIREIFSLVFKGYLFEYLESVFGFSDEIIFPSEFLEDIKEEDLICVREQLMKKLRK